MDIKKTDVFGGIGVYDKDIDEPVWEVVLGQYRDGAIVWYEHDKWFDLLNRLDNMKWF